MASSRGNSRFRADDNHELSVPAKSRRKSEVDGGGEWIGNGQWLDLTAQQRRQHLATASVTDAIRKNHALKAIAADAAADVYIVDDASVVPSPVTAKVLRKGSDGLRTQSATSTEDFMSEIKTLSALSHDNVMRILDVWVGQGGVPEYYISPAALGSLESLLRDAGPLVFHDGVHLPIPETAHYRFARQMLSAIAFIHNDHSLFHGQVCLGNFLVSADGLITLAGFGSHHGVATSDEDAIWLATDVFDFGWSLARLLTGCVHPHVSAREILETNPAEFARRMDDAVANARATAGALMARVPEPAKTVVVAAWEAPDRRPGARQLLRTLMAAEAAPESSARGEEDENGESAAPGQRDERGGDEEADSEVLEGYSALANAVEKGYHGVLAWWKTELDGSTDSPELGKLRMGLLHILVALLRALPSLANRPTVGDITKHGGEPVLTMLHRVVCHATASTLSMVETQLGSLRRMLNTAGSPRVASVAEAVDSAFLPPLTQQLRRTAYFAARPQSIWRLHDHLGNLVSTTAVALRMVGLDAFRHCTETPRPRGHPPPTQIAPTADLEVDPASPERRRPPPLSLAAGADVATPPERGSFDSRSSFFGTPLESEPPAGMRLTSAPAVGEDGTEAILRAVRAISETLAQLAPETRLGTPVSGPSLTPGPLLYKYCRDKGIPDTKKHARILQGQGITAVMLEGGQVTRAELMSVGIPLGVAAALLPRQ
eukprot:m.120606 g.120606  ORF g.120606 m.120606 type:complete len:719 (-) comp13349_c0_seq1:3842-5998(-)